MLKFIRTVCCAVIFVSVFFLSHSQAQDLSSEAKISLITVGPGDELYSGFGHSAFWVSDPRLGIDRVYNYGTFEFSPDFYVKFVKGKLDYVLSVSDLEYLVSNYREEKRTVTEQVLNLSHSQKDALYRFLEINYLPANRYYRYDFFFDNCSSRLRDALSASCKDSLRFNLSHDYHLSFRQLIDQYLQDKKFQDLGMDIGLGAPADRKATPYEYMFLPDYLKSAIGNAKIYRRGHWEPLVDRTNVIFEGRPRTNSTSFFSPAFFLWIVFAIVAFLTYRNFKKVSGQFFSDAVLLMLIGLLGIVLVFLWFFTDHNVTVKNWNLLWATPLHLPMAILLMKKKYPLLLQYYFMIYVIVCALLIVLWKILPEELNIAVLPLLLILILRSLYIFYYFKNSKN
jgi:hypothetical protein